jgi:MFS family permease
MSERETSDAAVSPIVAKAPPPTTPLPKFKLFIICLIQFCDAMSSTSIFPYLSQMTADLLGLDVIKDANLVGYYAGLVASCYYLTQLVASPIWGAISDRWGRKPVLIIGLFGTTLTCLAFGFCKWFWMAIVIRGLYGALNGNLGVIKTYLREITDQTNQARAFAFLGITYPMGNVLGPIIGGFLVYPARNIPGFDNIVFTTFPYLLPNVILCLVALCGALLGLFVLKEPARSLTRSTHSTTRSMRECCKNSWILSRGAILSCVVYGSLGFIQIIFMEVLPMWLWTPIANGGCGFYVWEIGLLNAATGGFIVLTQLVYTPWMNNKIGIKKAQIVSNALTLPIYFLMPELRLLAQLGQKAWLWILLIMFHMWRTALVESSFTSVILQVNNSVPKRELGTMNGIAQSVVSFARTVGPTIGTVVFAASISGTTSFPFDVHLVFYLTGVLAFILVFVAFLRPEVVPFEEDREDVVNSDSQTISPQVEGSDTKKDVELQVDMMISTIVENNVVPEQFIVNQTKQDESHVEGEEVTKSESMSPHEPETMSKE